MVEVFGALGRVVFPAALIPGRVWVYCSVTMTNDRFSELLIDKKTRLMKALVARNGRISLPPYPTFAMARVTRDEMGRYGSVAARPRLVGEAA